MNAIWAWTRLDLRRRWRSLIVLALLVAITGATVMTALAGARRGGTALDRLLARTEPISALVLPNQPNFDWTPFEQLPYVAALAKFPVSYGLKIDGMGDRGIDFPHANSTLFRTMDKPVILQGRLYDVNAPDEAMVTQEFTKHWGKTVGDTVRLGLPSPAQMALGDDSITYKQLKGPKLTMRIVGVIRSPWMRDEPGASGQITFSPGLTAKYPNNIIGKPGTDGFTPINAQIRLKGGAADIARLHKDLTRITGRSDIDVLNVYDQYRDEDRALTFEARCLAAFGFAALLAALFLVGQAIGRYAAATTTELQTARALGMTPRQVVVTSATGPVLAASLGMVMAVGVSAYASQWFPIGSAAYSEPDPGVRLDWLVLGVGAILIVVLAAIAAVASSLAAAGAARREGKSRASTIASATARAGLPVPIVVGTRFALETGRGRTAIPVRPALVGAVTGVLGVIAVFVFSQGVSDAATHPERFGQTYQAGAFAGFNGQDTGPVDEVVKALESRDYVTGVDNGRTAVATGPGDKASVPLYAYTTDPKPLPTVVVEGRMPETDKEVLIAPGTLKALGAQVGDSVPLSGSAGKATFVIVGTGFVPTGPHNTYNDGGWVTDHGYDSIFKDFKFHFLFVSVIPSLRDKAGLATLNKDLAKAVPAAAKSGLTLFSPADQGLDPGVGAQLREVRVLPIALGIFLALLAIAAVGHALATAVRRRSHDIAVLRAVGMTQWQCRWIVVTQATVLVLVGLVFGVPLGLAVGRTVWRTVADFTPLDYVAPTALIALLLIAPVALLVANGLAALPARRAAHTRIAAILRAE